MQYGDFIACITESLIHHEMQEGSSYNEAIEKVESVLLDWIIVAEERVMQKENDKGEEEDEQDC